MLYKKTIKEYYLPPDSLSFNTSLLLRLFEYVKENPGLTDVDIHKIVDTAHEWSEKYPILNMDAYTSIVTGVAPS